jgi:hypothetical protein
MVHFNPTPDLSPRLYSLSGLSREERRSCLYPRHGVHFSLSGRRDDALRLSKWNARGEVKRSRQYIPPFLSWIPFFNGMTAMSLLIFPLTLAGEGGHQKVEKT